MLAKIYRPARNAMQSGAANSQPTAQPRFDVNTLPSDVKAWAQRQLDNGIPAAQVIQRLNDHVSKGAK